MKLFISRLILTFISLGLLYQRPLFFKELVLVLFAIQIILSLLRFYPSFREKILCLLADKILFASVLIVLADFHAMRTGIVAWIIGCAFMHSGVDLLEISLNKSVDLWLSSVKNFISMVLTFLVLLLFYLQTMIPVHIHQYALSILSWSFACLSGIFIFQGILSPGFRKLIREA